MQGPTDRRGRGPHAKGDRGEPESGEGRRPPPPEATEHERAFLQKLEDAGTEIVVELRDGETVRGVIEAHDREVIRLRAVAGATRSLRKREIRHLYEP